MPQPVSACKLTAEMCYQYKLEIFRTERSCSRSSKEGVFTICSTDNNDEKK